LAKKLGHNDFKAINGWLYRWKCRFRIKFTKAQGEKDSPGDLSAEQQKSTKLLLHSQCRWNGFLSYKQATLSGLAAAIHRVTVLWCFNMSGNDKPKLLVIGKRATPRCFN
jgi:hypothetical protein